MGCWISIPDQDPDISETTRIVVLFVYTFEASIANKFNLSKLAHYSENPKVFTKENTQKHKHTNLAILIFLSTFYSNIIYLQFPSSFVAHNVSKCDIIYQWVQDDYSSRQYWHSCIMQSL